MCFTLFSDVALFLLPGNEHEEWTWGGTRILYLRRCCICYIKNAVLAYLMKYCIQPLPTKMGRNSVCPRQVYIKSLWLRQIHDPSGISPALDKALSTLLSCCSQHLFPVRVLASFVHLLRVVTLSDNDSKQIAAAPSFRMSALSTLRTLLVKVKKI